MTRPHAQAQPKQCPDTPPAPPTESADLKALLRGKHGDPFSLLGVHPVEGSWQRRGNVGGVHSEPCASHGCAQSITLTLPPLSGLYLTPETT